MSTSSAKRRYLPNVRSMLSVLLAVFSIEVLLADGNACCGQIPGTSPCNFLGCSQAYPSYCAVAVLEQILSCCGNGDGTAACTSVATCTSESVWCIRCASGRVCGTCATTVCGGGYGGCDPAGVNQMNCLADYGNWDEPSCSCNYSPILIKLTNGNGYHLSGVDDGVLFDYNGDGNKEHTAWTLPAEPIAFLVLDRNGNGRIDSGAELFGNFTPLSNGNRALNGFEALADIDAGSSSADGIVNAADPIFHELRLWVDANHNGISEPAELLTLDAGGVTAIELAYKAVNRIDEDGNKLGFEGHALFDVHGKLHRRKIFDVFFVGHH
jgi:hypothetical protein